jgi:hypothetical protein
VTAAAGENEDRSLPAREGRSVGRAAQIEDMLQVEAEIAGEGEAEAAMAEEVASERAE